MPESEPAELNVWSFHSVKGGVGKTTLSVLVARHLAERGERVLVVDLDLTGTSVADGLALRAPIWDEPARRRSLNHPPDRRDPVGDRLFGSRARTPNDPPFLNDFLLREQEVDWNVNEAHPEALAWSLPDEDPLADRLFILPSSAFPSDLDRVLALLYDEPFSAWVESRLEWLLDALLATSDFRHVVIDTPPCIPGISRAVLSAAMRLGRDVKVRLSDDGPNPPALWSASVRWFPWLVASEDRQDLRALERWLAEHDAEELSRLGVVVNRATLTIEQVLGKLQGGDPDGPTQLERSAFHRLRCPLVRVPSTGAAQLFSLAGPSEGAPLPLHELVAK